MTIFSSVLLPCYNVIYNDVDDTLDLTHIYIHTYMYMINIMNTDQANSVGVSTQP